MASPAPKSPEQSEKSRQYDRQLRLWGDHGQLALEAGHVCLVNATALGTEILKSIVLPGVGSVTVVDDHIAGDEDIGNNFFLETSSKGQNRGTEALRLILELNPSVRGQSVQESLHQILKENPDFFKGFSTVIATSLSEKSTQDLSNLLWELDVPFILCRSIGFLSSFRIQVKEHTVIETHPDNEQPDLHLDVPYLPLLEYFDKYDLDKVDLKDHGHIPWLVILYKALQKWKAHNDGRWPQSRKDKNQIKEIIQEYIRKDENGVPITTENFEEALRAVNTALAPSLLQSHIKDILYDPAAINLTTKSSQFWILCSALRSFVEGEGAGRIPVRGDIPDMTTSTENYITLQNIYRSRAASEAEVVYRRVQEITHELNREGISEADVKLFCRHAANLHLVRGSQISREYESGGPVASYIARHLEEPDVMMVHYVLLRAADKFVSEHGRHPGDWELDADISKLKNCVSTLLSEINCTPFPKDDHVHEMCRYGGAEIHSVSAFIGGCIAHEAIKIITKQYRHVNNTFIHDAASTNSAVFTF